MNTLKGTAQALTLLTSIQPITQIKSQQRHWLPYLRFSDPSKQISQNYLTSGHNGHQMANTTTFPIQNYMVTE
jgi:hypothetical protein